MADVPGQRSRASRSEPLTTSSGRRSCVILTAESHHGTAAQAWAARLFDLRAVERLGPGDAFPEALAADLLENGIDLLISYLNPVIVPGPILRTVRMAAINIHPAPPEWPGVGCVCYALYEGDRNFGVTAHIMTERVDQGPIIRVLRFPCLRLGRQRVVVPTGRRLLADPLLRGTGRDRGRRRGEAFWRSLAGPAPDLGRIQALDDPQRQRPSR
jgi:hypothetical protein